MKPLAKIMTAKGALLAATALVMSPALAAGYYATSAPGKAVSLNAIMGDFTPASADPRLLAQLATLPATSRDHFKFTPAVAASKSDRQLTIVVRAPGSSSASLREQMKFVAASMTSRIDSPVAITPVAYNLGAKVGLDRFSTPLTVPTAAKANASLDLAGMPKSAFKLETMAEKPSRFTSSLKVEENETQGATDRPLDGERNVAVDLTSSYSLTRNIRVTAGVRYKQADEPLAALTDSRRDNQAVYVGTKVRF